MKKKITAIFLCVALVAIAVVGASLAYFTDTKTATNTFTMGDVKIKLDETNVIDPEGDRVTSNAYDVYPGAVVTKDPIVHNVGKKRCLHPRYCQCQQLDESGCRLLSRLQRDFPQ